MLALLSVSAAARDKASKDIPPEPPTLLLASNITLDARNDATGRAQGLDAVSTADKTRMTTAHTSTVRITVVNLGAAPESVSLHWFWVGRYDKSRNWFRSGEGDKEITIDPKQSQTVFVEDTDIEAHDTKSKTEHYKSGGNNLGWVVTASNSNHEMEAIKASDPTLEGFAAKQPPKMRH